MRLLKSPLMLGKKQRFSVMCGPSAGAAVMSEKAVPDSITAGSINALLPSELFTCFLCLHRAICT